ncbi:MAG: hypothetical protein AB7O44_29455 [Hyphomicrobiaceae bacterium]
MSQRGIDFLESWKLKYIDPVRHPATPEEVDKLAARCLTLAKIVGIGEQEIQEELTPDDLRSHLAEEFEN